MVCLVIETGQRVNALACCLLDRADKCLCGALQTSWLMFLIHNKNGSAYQAVLLLSFFKQILNMYLCILLIVFVCVLGGERMG